MADDFVIRRRHPRGSPLKARRVGQMLYAPAAAGGAPVDPDAFPGLAEVDSDGGRGRLVSGSVSFLVHGALIGGLFLAAWLAPVEEIEEIIEISRFEEEVAREESAPAPRVVAESRGIYNPAPMAVAPQVVSPAVVQRAAPVVAARKLDMESLNTVQAPREVQRAARVVEQARAYQSEVQVTASPLAVDAQAPAIRGPIESVAPVGIQAGPRQVVSGGNSVGIADPNAIGSGSSVREGIASNRDVHGARTGARAQVNWAVGDGNLRGSGGTGTGPGGISWEDCMRRPAVQAYMGRIRSRVLARWALPPDARGDQNVQLRFTLDPAGTASRVSVVRTGDPRLGESAVDALRSASPFDHMSDQVRCLAGNPILATFRNPTIAKN